MPRGTRSPTGLADPAWTAEPSQAGDLSALPPAVVMDIDETVLDNSEPQAEMMLKGTCFDEFPATWDAWLAKRSAPAVPGAAEFIRAARSMKDPSGRPVRVFFITNRECARRAGNESACPQQDDTAANLAALGLGSPTLADDLMLKGEQPEWESEKLARREAVAAGHRIVLNVGDDLADFLPDVQARDGCRARRRALRARGLVGPALVPAAEPDVRLLAGGAGAGPGRGPGGRARGPRGLPGPLITLPV